MKVVQALCLSTAVGVASKAFLGLRAWQCVLLSTLGFLGLGGMKPVYRFFRNLPRDLQ